MTPADDGDAAPMIDSLAKRLDRIVEQLQGIHVSLESLRVSLTGLSQVSEDHESRLRRLEAWTHRLSPWLAVGTFLAGAVASAWLGDAVRGE